MIETRKISPPTYHHLVDDIVYGPVVSRRYGRTVGLNFSPNEFKDCNFNCVYCQLGWNDSAFGIREEDYPRSYDVIESLKAFLKKAKDNSKFDTLVISGNGEPTLNPKFSDIVNDILEFRNQLSFDLPVVCFTNGTMLKDELIFRALQKIDECAVKLDANPQKTNLPIENDSIQSKLDSMNQLDNLVVQSCFYTGDVSNSGHEHIFEWLTWLETISPKRIDLYTISRDTAHPGVEPIDIEVLNSIRDVVLNAGLGSVRIC